MDAYEFVNWLESGRPRDEDLRAQGRTDAEIAEFNAGLVCQLRPTPARPIQGNPLIDLMSISDTSQLEIGSIHFLREPERIQIGNGRHGFVVARFAGDPVVVADSGNVTWMDPADPTFVIALLATCGGRFLDAMVECLTHAPEVIANKTAGDQLALRCAKAAGVGANQNSISFYRQFIGADQ